MTFDPAWHTKYMELEVAETEAQIAYRTVKKSFHRARTDETKSVRESAMLEALDALRLAGKARWEFEMSGTRVVDIATLRPDHFVSLSPRSNPVS